MRRGESGLSCLVAINKPVGLSSHDVVNRVRRILGERRVGHAGTLDPLASGVMIVGVGTATRLLGQLTLEDKRYVASIAFGSETSTDDSEGETIRSAAVPSELWDAAYAGTCLSGLVGTCDQVPPAYSAISVGGERAYARARAGKEVELAARPIEIYDAALLAIGEGEPLVWVCSFHVSKGTYIRSIARDVGRAVGSAAHLGGLTRTASGPIELAQCLTLEELARLGSSEALYAQALDPVDALMLPRYELGEDELRDVQVGRHLTCPMVADGARHSRPLLPQEKVCLVCHGRLMGIWERRGASIACVTNFPDGVAGVRRTL